MAKSERGVRRGTGVLAVWLCLLPAVVAAQTARVSGSVTDAASGAPVTSGVVQFCSASDQCTTVTTSASGTYTVLLPAGTYYASTNGFEAQGLVNVWHTGEPCPGACDGLDRPFRLPSLVISLAGRFVNFALPRGGSIEGHVTNALSGAPVSGVWVRLHDAATDAFVVAVLSDAAGAVRLRGLMPGAYTASASGTAVGFTNQLHAGIPCLFDCPRGGQAISVEAGRVSPLDFALTPGGGITGRVIAANTQLPVAGASIVAYLDSGDRVLLAALANTDAQGNYSVVGLPAGRYRLVALSDGTAGQVFGGEICIALAGCQPAFVGGRGTVIEVTAGVSVTNRNFTLARGFGFDGVVTEAGTGAPVSNGRVTIYQSVNGRAISIGSVSVNAQGAYQVSGLPEGDYFGDFWSPTHAPMTLGGRLCPWTRCATEMVEADTPIRLSSSLLAQSYNLQTPRAGILSVSVADDVTALPLGGTLVAVAVGGSTPAFVDANVTRVAGNAVFNGVAPGTYHVLVGGAGKIPEAYDNVPCPSQRTCTAREVVALGRAVTVTAGTSTILLASLAPASGAPFTPDPPSAESAFGTVTITPSPTSVGPVPTDFVLEAAAAPGPPAVVLAMPSSGLTVPGVPAGTYWLRVRARNAAGTSPPSDWTRIAVNGGEPEPVDGLDTWISGNRLTMSWAPSSVGAPASDYIVEAGSAAGLANIARLPVTGRHFTYAPVPPGVYFLRVRARNGRGESAALEERMVVVGDAPAPPRRPGILIPSLRGSTLTLSWQVPPGGATDYVLEAGTSRGRADIGSFNVGAVTTFSAANVPPGTYFLRVRARNARGLGLPTEDVRLTVPSIARPARFLPARQ